MNNENGSLDTLIETKLNEDSDFQESIKDLPDEERETKVNERKSQLLQEEATTLYDKAQKASKAEELANNYKARAEKAEQELKKLKPADKPDKGDDDNSLSPKDLYALMQAQVPEDDVDEVIKASKLLGKPINEAVKDPIVKGILQTRAEFRKTAEATNTQKSRTGNKTASGDELLKGLSKGEVPTKGSKEAEALFWAKRGKK